MLAVGVVNVNVISKTFNDRACQIQKL